MEAFEPVPVQHLNPNRPKPSFKQQLAMGLRVLATIFMTMLVNVYLLGARTLYPLLGRKFYRRVADFVQHAWFDAAFLLLDRTRMHVYGDHKSLHTDDFDKRPRIVLANHATDVDWFYLWMVAHTCENPRSGVCKVMLKEGIKKVPLFGWLLDNLDFIWMKRDWDSDRNSIKKMIERLLNDGEHLWIIIFPEGMTVNTQSMAKSHEFARNENRPTLDLTLLPREKGFSAMLEAMKHLDPEIVDVTLAFESFSGEIPTWEMGYERNNDHLVPNAKKLMAGMSGDVFIDVRTFSTKDVLTHPGGVKAWLDERWVRKDQFLKHFVKNEAFPRDHTHFEVKIPQGSFSRLGAIALCDAALIFCLGKLSTEVVRKVRSAIINPFV
jgi:lysocardiolipin and lysophospholipid acyltransferase